MVSRIQTFCKVLPSKSRGSRHSGDDSITINNNEATATNGKVFNFTRIFNAEPKNTNDLYSLTCGNLTQYFLNGFNTSLLLLGSAECLQGILTDDKGPLIYLAEHLSHVTTKYFKKQEPSKISVRSSLNLANESLPYLKIKNDVEMRIYKIKSGMVEDLSNTQTQRTSLDARPSNDYDNLTGCNMKNLRGYSIVGCSSKEVCRHLASSLKNIDLLSLDDSCVTVEFYLRKISEFSSAPVTCWFRITLVAVDGASKESSTPFHLLSEVCNADQFEKQIDSSSSMDLMSCYLTDVINSNCVTKAITFLPSLEYTYLTGQLLDLLLCFNNVSNHPVPNAPFLKTYLGKYYDVIKKLKNSMKKEHAKENIVSEELKIRLATAEQAYKEVCQDKEDLLVQLQELRNDYQQLLSKNEDVSSERKASAAAKLKVTKELVDLKLKDNHMQQNLQKHYGEMKSELLGEQESLRTVERNLQFEQKLHVDLKTKYKKLKSSEADLNEEYLNLKLNFHNLKEDLEDQKKHITDQEKTISSLLHGKERTKYDYETSNSIKNQEFVKHLRRFSSLLPSLMTLNDASSVVSTNSNVAVRSYSEELGKLESEINAVKLKFTNKSKDLTEYKCQLAEKVTTSSLLGEENLKLKHYSRELERTLQQLSKDYQERLEGYINNVKDYVSNNSVGGVEKLEEEMKKMSIDHRAAITNDTERAKDSISCLQKEKASILTKYKKLSVAYRQLCEKKDMTKDINFFLPTDTETDIFQMKKEMELQEKLDSANKKVQNLETKFQVIEKMKEDRDKNISNEDTILRHFQDVQSNLEEEKGDLLVRCAMFEEELQIVQHMKNEEIFSLQSEIAHLRRIIDQELYSHPQRETGTQALPPLRQHHYKLRR